MNACALCHRPLTDPASKRRGLGLECWTSVLLKVQRAQADGLEPFGPFFGDILLVRACGRAYANIERLFNPRAWSWGLRKEDHTDTALAILSQFLAPIPAGKNYTGQPHPSATKLAEEFSGRFLSQMPYPGGIILQRSILAWLMRHDIPLDEIRTYGVLA